MSLVAYLNKSMRKSHIEENLTTVTPDPCLLLRETKHSTQHISTKRPKLLLEENSLTIGDSKIMAEIVNCKIFIFCWHS